MLSPYKLRYSVQYLQDACTHTHTHFWSLARSSEWFGLCLRLGALHVSSSSSSCPVSWRITATALKAFDIKVSRGCRSTKAASHHYFSKCAVKADVIWPRLHAQQTNLAFILKKAIQKQFRFFLYACSLEYTRIWPLLDYCNQVNVLKLRS